MTDRSWIRIPPGAGLFILFPIPLVLLPKLRTLKEVQHFLFSNKNMPVQLEANQAKYAWI